MLFTKSLLDKLSALSGALILSLSLVTLLSPSAVTLEPLGRSNLPEQSLSPFADGTYLYGQSDKPEQIGKEYLVFQVQDGKVIGAIYLPQSEFSCFFGMVGPRAMKLSIIDPYDNTVSPYAITVQEGSSVAAAGGQLVPSVVLEGYQPLPQLSNLDRHILGICLNQVD
jgi:hypothetical protein